MISQGWQSAIRDAFTVCANRAASRRRYSDLALHYMGAGLADEIL